MFRRLFWMSTGAGLALWGRSRAIRAVERNVPPQVINLVARTARELADDVNRRQGENAGGRRPSGGHP